MSLQALLLRALESHEFWPVGASEPRQVDVRIVAATNEHLPNLVEKGRFRADLLYRLEHLPHGVFEQPAIVHLCSNSLTEPDIAEATYAGLRRARAAGDSRASSSGSANAAGSPETSTGPCCAHPAKG